MAADRWVGVLALQGDFAMHVHAFEALGQHTREVRTALDLAGLSHLVIPGGESTTMTKLLTPDLRDPLVEFCRSHPVWGTCAGMIMLSNASNDPRIRPLRLMDTEVDRNGYGRQVFSFEAPLRVAMDLGGEAEPMRGIFIRAPRLIRCGAAVKPLAWFENDIVCAREGHWLCTAFHPELTDDRRIQNYFLNIMP
jgi:pyridoxal 5'-phosphate synthase pdxT subunit